MKTRLFILFVLPLVGCVSGQASSGEVMSASIRQPQPHPRPHEVVDISDRKTVQELVRMFPDFESQPAEGFSTGQWPAEYIIGLNFTDGAKREIFVSGGKWTAGAKE